MNGLIVHTGSLSSCVQASGPQAKSRLSGLPAATGQTRTQATGPARGQARAQIGVAWPVLRPVRARSEPGGPACLASPSHRPSSRRGRGGAPPRDSAAPASTPPAGAERPRRTIPPRPPRRRRAPRRPARPLRAHGARRRSTSPSRRATPPPRSGRNWRTASSVRAPSQPGRWACGAALSDRVQD